MMRVSSLTRTAARIGVKERTGRTEALAIDALSSKVLALTTVRTCRVEGDELEALVGTARRLTE